LVIPIDLVTPLDLSWTPQPLGDQDFSASKNSLRAAIYYCEVNTHERMKKQRRALKENSFEQLEAASHGAFRHMGWTQQERDHGNKTTPL
jgi:hypothetical protein